MADQRITFLASSSKTAQAARDQLVTRYKHVSPEEADIIVALGGDGFMLQTQLEFMDSDKPVYGMNKGTVGFLMNEFRVADLHERLEKTVRAKIHPCR